MSLKLKAEGKEAEEANDAKEVRERKRAKERKKNGSKEPPLPGQWGE
jgi:hypothetical protein